MLKSISLQNFQSHERTSLDFVPGINIILGSNDQGKSAIKRAIRWVVENRPLGDGIRSDWGGDTNVVVLTDGLFMIQRDKTNTSNAYWLTKQGEPGEVVHATPYEGFNKGVPEPVQQALNMWAINFQHQMDAPFMLSWTPPEVTRYINELCNLDSIDRAFGNINKEIREWDWKAKLKEEEIETAEESAKKLAWVHEAEGKIATAENKEGKLLHRMAKCKNLVKLVNGGRAVAQALSEWPDMASEKAKVEGAIGSYREIRKRVEKANAIANLDSHARVLMAQIEKLERKIENGTQAFATSMPDVCPLCGK